MFSRTVEVTVRLTLTEECDVAEVLQEMDYSFSFNETILDTEIIDYSEV